MSECINLDFCGELYRKYWKMLAINIENVDDTVILDMSG